MKITTKLSVMKLVSTSKRDYLLATLTDAKGNPVKNLKVGFADNGVKYINTDNNGKARYFIDHLKQGKHSIKVAFFGNDKYAESERIKFNFWIGKIPTTLTVERTGDYLVATLKDDDGKPINKANVGFADNGVKYILTDDKGKAKYSIAHFGYGTFTIKVAFWGNDKYRKSGKITFKFTNEPPRPQKRKYGRSTKAAVITEDKTMIISVALIWPKKL